MDIKRKWWNTGELGWKTIRGEAMRQKIVYYGKIAFMKEERWIKKIWKNMHEIQSNWLQEVEQASQELKVDLEKWKQMRNSQD